MTEDNKYEPTIVLAGDTNEADDATEIDFGSGIAEPVIDREEWDKILAEVDGVSRVLVDISPKPIATIEWE